MADESQELQTVHVVSLGCPKNRVDTEVMLGHLAQDGLTHVEAPQDADVILVNTCAFIDSAKEESVDAILEMAEHKDEGRCKKLVVSGCLSQRYAPDLSREIPQIDGFIGTGNLPQVREVVRTGSALPILGQPSAHPRLSGPNKLVPFRHQFKDEAGNDVTIPDPDFELRADSPRLATLPRHMAYLKISEGCSNTCAFCIIPKLRGPARSRTIDDVVLELERLLEAGAVEVNLIAQDLCAYGKDLSPKQSLARLLRRLDATARQARRPVWIRCMYAYPRGLTKEVMHALENCETIVPYLDMPLQHVSDRLLRSMKRGKGGEATRSLLRRLRQEVSNLTLRTTFITGLPGETEEDFQEMLECVHEIEFERMGAFVYSPEEDTPAATMPNQIERVVAEERRDRLMQAQRAISAAQHKALVGQTLDVLVEGPSPESELLWVGRHPGQAPEIDGVVYINDGKAQIGDVLPVRIEQAGDYDLVGPIVDVASPAR